MERTCKKCQRTFPLEQFVLANTINGKRHRRHVCQKCYWLTNTSVQKEKFREWYIGLKKQHHCARCGIADYRVLDFHHTDPSEKLFNVGDGGRGSMAKQKVLDEIKKCEALCANCHRIKEWEKKNEVVHE